MTTRIYGKQGGLVALTPINKLESLIGKYIQEISNLNFIGVGAYQYEKHNSSFQLTFGATLALELYRSGGLPYLGTKGLKGNYSNYPTPHKNWWYYLVD